MNANRFYFICFLTFILYVSLTLHEITDRSYKHDDWAGTSEIADFLNRSIVAKLDDKRYCRAPRIAIFISPHEHRYLQLYWDVEYVQENDWISLFKEDPQSGKEVFPIYTAEVKNTTGIISTNITKIPASSEDLSFKSECWGFWAVYFTINGSASAVSCLKTNPTWMNDMRSHLGNIQIKRIFIPGTHDSGSYSTTNEASSLNVVERFVFTQEEDVLSQLIHGIRYLDLRVSSNPHLTDRWWINHGVVRIQPLKNILNYVKKFVQKTKEIVILDFHGFPAGFRYQLESHTELINYLKSELSEWAAIPNWNATCNELWNSNKTLIISYNYEEIVKQNSNLLWTPVSHKWANVQSNDELKEYFTKIVESRPSYSWAAMAELTPTLWSIVTYKTNSLREMAHNVNPHVTTWFRGIWGRTCNIVAVDFFRGTDIVETAIEWNIRKTQRHICDIH
ncbi:hypothetical protein PGB90_009487 [Kerria lacca]